MKNRRMQTLTAVFALMLGAAIAYAHNGVEHVMGTVTAVTESSITVDTVKHTPVTVLLDASTKFTKNDAKITRQDLKVGDRVVIDAKENSDKKLVGLTVKLGSAAHDDHSDQKSHADHPDHKMPADHHKE
jgi:hypothetical protein